MSPHITTVDVVYSDSDPEDGTITTYTHDDGAVTEAVGGPAGLSAVITMSKMVFLAQGVSTNIMGDELNSLLQDWSEGAPYEDEDVLFFTVGGHSLYKAVFLRTS